MLAFKYVNRCNENNWVHVGVTRGVIRDLDHKGVWGGHTGWGQIRRPADRQIRQKKLMLSARADLQTCEWEQWLNLPGLPEIEKHHLLRSLNGWMHFSCHRAGKSNIGTPWQWGFHESSSVSGESFTFRTTSEPSYCLKKLPHLNTIAPLV